MHLQYGAKSDQGKIRASNEDYYVANAARKIFLVADGMGGHAAGEIASRITAEKIEAVLVEGSAEPDIESLLLKAVQRANSAVYEAQKVHAEYRGMGSTLTALAFSEGSYCIAQVGDSRAYLFRNGTLDQLTEDHSLVWPLYKNNIITKEDIARNPRKNLITRSIGTQPHVEADLLTGSALEGDLFLLCSDGLTDVLSDHDIGKILSQDRTPQVLSELLVNEANDGGGPDNVTVVLVRV